MDVTIFAKIRLRPSQLRTIADRRFADAQCLRDSGHNERANGSIYLAGFVIECLLKARLLEKYRWLETTGSPDGLSKNDRFIWSLCYRSHDLDEILDRLPEVTKRLEALEQGNQLRSIQKLRSICAQWTIFARYSPKSAKMAEAEEFLRYIQEIKEWLK